MSIYEKYATFIAEQTKAFKALGITTVTESILNEEASLAKSAKHVESLGNMKSGGTSVAKAESGSFSHGEHHYHPAESQDTNAHFITQHKTTGKVSTIKVPLTSAHHDESSVPHSHVKSSLPDEHKEASKKITKSINGTHFG
jgi:hypothetical protein